MKKGQRSWKKAKNYKFGLKKAKVATLVAGVTYSDANSAPVPKCLNRVWIWVRLFFKFENPTSVQTPATIIDLIVIYPCFCIKIDHADSCYCRDWKVTQDPGPVFPKFFTPCLDLGTKEKSRIQPESTPALLIRSHLRSHSMNSHTTRFIGPVLQFWTWSGFRIAIQPDSAIQNQTRIGLNFEKTQPDQIWTSKLHWSLQ